jgi:hypothetical protein
MRNAYMLVGKYERKVPLERHGKILEMILKENMCEDLIGLDCVQ